MLDACVGCIGYWATGFAFAYGEISEDDSPKKYSFFIGIGNFFLAEYPREMYYNFFFQYGFAASACTIVSGAIAERMRFEAYFLYALFLTMWVYPVASHWAWGVLGWPNPYRTDLAFIGLGIADYAGDGAVHCLSGWAGLAGAMVVGPRIGRFGKNGEVNDINGHNTLYYVLGVFIIWFGWYGFNPGCTFFLYADGIPNISRHSQTAVVNTTMAPAAGAIACMICSAGWTYFRTRKYEWDLMSAANGALSGLVGVTGSCAWIEPWAGMLVGLSSGVCYTFFSHFVASVMKVDDPLDVVALHLGCGMWGLWCAAALAQPELFYTFLTEVYGITLDRATFRNYGFFYPGSNGKLLAANIVWFLVVGAWTFGQMYPFFFILKKIGILRVSKEFELQGLDYSFHGGCVYQKCDKLTNGDGKLSGTNGYDDHEKQLTVSQSHYEQLNDRLNKLETLMAQNGHNGQNGDFKL